MKQHLPFVPRAALLLGGQLLAVATLPIAAFAAPTMPCVGAPFSFTDIETAPFMGEDRPVDIEWQARGMTALGCGGASILGIDVWEHAYVRLTGTAHPAGKVKLMGRINLRVSVPDGGTVLLGGIISGRGQCTGMVCVVDAEVRASTRGGVKLRMLERVTIDLASGMITDIDVLNIVIEFTSAG